jgi:hypothetical protein
MNTSLLSQPMLIDRALALPVRLAASAVDSGILIRSGQTGSVDRQGLGLPNGGRMARAQRARGFFASSHRRGCSAAATERTNQELRPYPTAIALIALQNPSNKECQSLAYLERAVADERSALALCMAVLCLGLYGIQAERCVQAATALYDETQFLQSIKTSALALLALQSLNGDNAFRLER